MAKAFLEEVAESALKRNPTLAEVTFVFPNRRAALFFRKYLSEGLTKPIFSPNLITIEEFFNAHTTKSVPDKLQLVHELYLAYQKIIPGEEAFDKFYYWGEMLLRDFDELDKYLVDADLLFKDLSSVKELEASLDYFTEEQQEYLKSFWAGFEEFTSDHKTKFLFLWQKLIAVYRQFQEQLTSKGWAYEGLLQREMVKQVLANQISLKGNYEFVGFNALTAVEEKLISYLVTEGNTIIHWDLDQYYLHDQKQEAGRFFREYQQHAILGNTFPSDIPAHLDSIVAIQQVGAVQKVGQAKLLAEYLANGFASGMKPEETLVVLPDEKMMLPVLYGIPDHVEKFNVTMGFPLSSTPMFNLIELMVEMQIAASEDGFNHRQVLAILGHPYLVGIDAAVANRKRKDILKKNWVCIPEEDLATELKIHQLVFQYAGIEHIIDYLKQVVYEIGSDEATYGLDKEFAFHFYTFFNRLQEVVGNEFTDLRLFLRLFRQLARSQKIPFSGEPLEGLQIMGVLETRNLDFKNVFILSLNEGSLPGGNSKGSFIPHSIRKAYKLPTINHQDSMYSYLFYRVMQRAENVFLFYNTETDDLGEGEMSRYLRQLMYESKLPIQRKVAHNAVIPNVSEPIIIEKDKTILDKLAKLNEGSYRFKGISPSSLNAYLDCKLKFYFQYVAKVKEADEVEEDLDARVLGNILHDVMERFYKDIIEKKKSNQIVLADYALANKQINKLIDEMFIKTFNLSGKKVTYEGQRLIVKEMVNSFAEKIIENDKKHTPFIMEGLEESAFTFRVKIDHAPGYAILGGKVDRADRVKENGEEILRIIDYKTGKDELGFYDIHSLFVPHKKRNKAAFQTLIYTLLYQSNRKTADLPVVPGLLNRINLFADEFSFGFFMNKKKLHDVRPHMADFEKDLQVLLSDIFNPSTVFDQTEEREFCRYCAYKDICHR